jgi:2-hydroxy-3-keto-5-methylthiopentenyl-1-phosphate phosphatase
MKFKVFSDFDGTITKIDVGHQVFKTFSGDMIYPLIKDWKDNKITSRELLSKECENIKINDLNELFDLFEKQSIDDHFVDFVNYCKSNEIEIFILSDGMHVYIDSILKRYNLESIPFYSNKFNYEVDENENITVWPTFPYTDSECNMCGNCKRNHLLYHKSDDEVSIYIGDGYSDRCPAEYADIVFCKGDLKSYCTAKKIPFYEFNNFSDIIKRLQELIIKKRINTKKRPELKRKEILLQG